MTNSKPVNSRPPRIYRRSHVLYFRIDGPPIRQPFLRHIEDDDFVAAYLGYDKIDGLDKVRLYGLVIFNYHYRNFGNISWSTRYLCLLLIFEVLETRHFKWKVSAFKAEVAKVATSIDHEAANFAYFLQDIALHITHVDQVDPDDQQYRRLATTILQRYIMSRRGFSPSTIPAYDRAARTAVILENTQDLEGLLRAAALLFSGEELTKYSVWSRKFPRTIQERPREAEHGSSAGGLTKTEGGD